MSTTLFEVTLVVATLLCSLVAGFLFAFAVVVMPGIGRLEDGNFIRAFQVIDGVIQKNQPIFMLVWVGSILSLLAAAVLSILELQDFERLLIMLAVVVYLFGVQLPTATINIPLNNRLQALDVKDLNDATARRARDDFESRWNRWNAIRTACAILTAIALMFLLIAL
jgi:uncharacterized membrane protein